MFQLYINDNLIDLPEERNQIGLEYAIMSIEDIGGRTGAKSYEYSVPTTSLNLQAIGFTGEIPNISLLPYTRIKARAYEDGVDLNIRFAEITSISDVINFRLYGDNVDFYTDIKDLLVSDIDLSDWDHFWDDPTIKVGLLKSTGYQYPIIEYQIQNRSLPVRIRSKNLYPAIFYEELLAKCFEHTGYAFTNDMAGYYSDKLILPFSGTDYVRNDDGEKYLTKVSVSTDYHVAQNNAANGDKRKYLKWDILNSPTEYFKLNTSNWKSQQNISKPRFGGAIEFADRVRVSGNLHLIMEDKNSEFTSGNSFAYRITIMTLDSGLSVNETHFDTTFYWNIPGLRIQTLDIPFTDLLTGENFDLLAVKISPLVGDFYANAIYGFNIFAGSYLEITSCEVITPREIVWNPQTELPADERPSFLNEITNHNQNFITMNSIWGDISFADLLKNYCLMFGLLPIVDNIKKTVRLFRFEGLKNNINKTKDWTLKIDKTEKPEITFVDDNYGQRSLFAWQIDEYTDENEIVQREEPEGANSVLVINNQNLELEKTIVELDFAASLTVERFITRNIIWIPMVDENGSRTSKTQRVLFTRDTFNAQNAILMQFTNELITAYPRTYIPYFTDALHFDKLRSLHYVLMDSIISNYKKLSEHVRLNASDINQIDFTAPIYLQQHEAFFYLSKVEDYKPSTRDTTTTELVKLNILVTPELLDLIR